MNQAHDAVVRLKELGFNEEEAQVYVELCRAGSSKATDIASAAKLSRPRTYRILEVLAQRGYVAASMERPTRFTAFPVETVLKDYRAELEARANLVTRAETELKATLEGLRLSPDGADTGPRFAIQRGREEILRRTGRLIDGARENLEGIFVHPAAAVIFHSARHLDKCIERAKQGVRVRLILNLRATEEDAFAASTGANIEFRSYELPSVLVSLIADRKEVLTVLEADASARLRSENSRAIWTNAEAFVEAQRVLFNAIWEKAKPLSRPALHGAERYAHTARASPPFRSS